MSNKPAIPSWQRAPAASPSSAPLPGPHATSERQPQPDPASSAEKSAGEAAQAQEPGDASLAEQASRFLEDPTIRDAPRENKVAFLESKGVSWEEIGKLLGTRIAEDASPDLKEAGERAWSTAPPKPTQSPTPIPPPRDIPPIVTYPEFLAQPTQQPPLITTQRLLNTAYIAGGLAATMYGLSKYIIAPMARNMTDSRHDFAAHTQEQLESLNNRLKDAASVDPATNATSKISDLMDNVSEADSDPTELYHRDYGTQTSPSLSRRPSSASDAEAQPVVKAHEDRLRILTSHLRELESTRTNDFTSSDSLKTKLSDLTTYLSEMSYQNQYYSGTGGFYGGSYGLPKSKDGKDDQIEVLKSDIRAVKGVFLSARNFPAGGRNTMPTGRAGG